MTFPPIPAIIALASALALTVPARAETLTLYAAQHEQTVDMITAAFTKATGIEVKVRTGEPPELASQLVREGAASPADVFFTANAPELTLLSEKGLLAPVAPATLARIPARYSSPKGDWLGVLAREDVLAYNTSMIQPSALPASLLELAKPAWSGKLAIAPTDADFLPLVGAVVALHGRQAALDWLKGLRQNAALYDDNEGVVAAVERGANAVGIINNYYWPRLREEKGEAQMHSAIYHFKGGDVGALLNISGAAVLKSAPDAAAAQTFLAFLVSTDVQQMLAKANVTFEYPLVPGIAANPILLPFDQVRPPSVTQEQLGDDRDAAELLREAGLI